MNTPQRRRSARPGPSNNLHTQLFSHALTSVVLPLTLTGSLAFFVLSHLLDGVETDMARSRDAYTHDVARTQLMAQAGTAAREVDVFLGDRIAEVMTWASNRMVADAVLAAHARHVAQGLPDTPIGELESRFRDGRRLNVSPEAEAYLRRQIASSAYFTEMLLCDRNGFMVAFTHPTNGFVQSDEIWWQEAWERGMAFGDVEFNDSSGLWSMDVALRIDEPATEDPIGVVKAVLAVEPIHRIADITARTTRGAHVRIATSGGALVAETASDHAPERIMNPEFNVRERGKASVRDAFASQRTGYAVDEHWLTGYSRTGGSEAREPTSARFVDIAWIVLLQMPTALVHKPNNALRAIDRALHDWRRTLAITIVTVLGLSALCAVAFASGTARRYAASLGAIRKMAEQAAQGKDVSATVIAHPAELAQLRDAVFRLSRVFKAVSDRTTQR